MVERKTVNMLKDEEHSENTGRRLECFCEAEWPHLMFGYRLVESERTEARSQRKCEGMETNGVSG